MNVIIALILYYDQRDLYYCQNSIISSSIIVRTSNLEITVEMKMLYLRFMSLAKVRINSTAGIIMSLIMDGTNFKLILRIYLKSLSAVNKNCKLKT